MNRKRVLIVTGVFYPEPIVSANLLTDLATELSKRYEVTVLRPKPTRPAGFKQISYDNNQFPFKVIEINSYTCAESSFIGRFHESYSHGKVCAKYIEEHHAEINFIYNDSWHLFGLYTVSKAAVKYGIPYITPVQDIYPESLMSKLPEVNLLRRLVMTVLGPMDRYTLRHATKVHTISNKMVEHLSATRGLPTEKFVVVRNWQDEKAFVDYKNTANVLKEGLFTFMYLGNLGPLAGVDTLFEAFEMAGLSDAKLVIAGSGSVKEYLQKKAKEYSCNIEFWDVPSGKVPETQGKADVMLLPVKKGFAMSSIPSKLPAYMFSAKPIIASVDLESDTAKCIVDGQAGWVVEPENVTAIAKAMVTAKNASSPSLAEMGLNGFNFAINNLSKEINLQKLVAACSEVIDG